MILINLRHGLYIRGRPKRNRTNIVGVRVFVVPGYVELLFASFEFELLKSFQEFEIGTINTIIFRSQINYLFVTYLTVSKY